MPLNPQVAHSYNMVRMLLLSNCMWQMRVSNFPDRGGFAVDFYNGSWVNFAKSLFLFGVLCVDDVEIKVFDPPRGQVEKFRVAEMSKNIYVVSG